MLLAEHAPEIRAERARTAQHAAHVTRQAAPVRRPHQPLRLARARRVVGHGLVRLGQRLAGTEPHPARPA